MTIPMEQKKFFKGLQTYLCLLALTLNFAVFAWADAETITTIILIDRVAELVELTEDGEVLQRHLAVPDYFSSGRSHNSSLKQSLAKLKDYGYQENFDLPGSSLLSSSELQRHMTKEKKDFSPPMPYEKGISVDGPSLDQSKKSMAGILTNKVTTIIKLQTKRSSPQALETLSFVDVFYPRIEDSQLKQRDIYLMRSSIGDIAKAYV